MQRYKYSARLLVDGTRAFRENRENRTPLRMEEIFRFFFSSTNKPDKSTGSLEDRTPFGEIRTMDFRPGPFELTGKFSSLIFHSSERSILYAVVSDGALAPSIHYISVEYVVS